MKTIQLIILFSFFAFYSNAQSLSPTVISSFGGSDPNSGTSWTMGESLTHTLDNGQNILTQGFHNDSCICITITNDQDEEIIFNVFPNPTVNYVRVTNNTKGSYQLSVFSIDGKLKMQGSYTEPDVVIDLSSYSKGMYILRINYEDDSHKNKKVFTRKINKQ